MIDPRWLLWFGSWMTWACNVLLWMAHVRQFGSGLA